MNPAFNTQVPRGGYAWWYLDALSDDGQYGLTVIAFIGSVFSPYYAWARRRGHGLADPLNHCAMNVALYARPGSTPRGRWAMTERGRAAVERSATRLQIGASSMAWEGDALVVTIDETTVPWPTRLRGRITLRPDALMHQSYPLDPQGLHAWRPIAPCAQVEARFTEPGLHWRGTGYLDSNRGQRPLEQDFAHWDWSRAALADKRSAVLYDVQRTDGSALALALAFDAQGRAEPFAPPPAVTLPATGWRMPRATRSDDGGGGGGGGARVEQTLEDAPFYSRSVLRTRLLGEDAAAVHESLSLKRWARPVVQAMLPFRMPRREG